MQAPALPKAHLGHRAPLRSKALELDVVAWVFLPVGAAYL